MDEGNKVKVISDPTIMKCLDKVKKFRLLILYMIIFIIGFYAVAYRWFPKFYNQTLTVTMTAYLVGIFLGVSVVNDIIKETLEK